MSEDIITLMQEKEVEIPRVPNFIRVNGDIQPVSKFSDENLESIAKCWTQDLLKRKKEQLKQK